MTSHWRTAPEIVLALDPGITTGYAVTSPTGELIESGNLFHEDIEESLLCEIAKRDPSTLKVVMEETLVPTHSSMNRELQSIIVDLMKIFPVFVMIRPGEWKSSMIATRRFPTLLFPHPTPHQRDAYHLAMYFISKEAHEKRRFSHTA